jgi:hypothetical protein
VLVPYVLVYLFRHVRGNVAWERWSLTEIFWDAMSDEVWVWISCYICILLEVTKEVQEKLDYKCRIEVEIRVQKQSCQSLDGDVAFPEFVVLFINQKNGN